MHTRRMSSFVVAAWSSGILALVCAPAFALTPQDRVQVIGSPSILVGSAADAAGRLLVIWSGNGTAEDGGGQGTFGRRYTRDGAPLGGVFRLNDASIDSALANVAAAADGRFVVTFNLPAGDPSQYQLFAQCFNANGTARSAPVAVNVGNAPPFGPISTEVAINRAGAFVVMWESQEGPVYYQRGIRAQRFDANCAKAGAEILLVPAGTDTQSSSLAGVVIADAGNFEAFWRLDGDVDGYRYERFAADGTALGIGSAPAGVAASNSHGDFVLGWTEQTDAGLLFTKKTYVQRYDRNGQPIDAQSALAVDTTFSTSDPFGGVMPAEVSSIGPGFSMDDDGDLFATWVQSTKYVDCNPPGPCESIILSSTLFGQRLAGGASSIQRQGQPFKIAVTDTGTGPPQPASDGEGNFSVAWFEGPAGHGLDAGVIYQRRYRQDAQNARLSVSISGAHSDFAPVTGGPAGTYSFVSRFCNTSQATIADLTSRTVTLTGGNVLLNRDRNGTSAPGGAGSSIDFDRTGDDADGLLSPNQCVDVPYTIGLATRAAFSFSVDILGDQGNDPNKVSTLLKPPPPIPLPAGSVTP